MSQVLSKNHIDARIKIVDEHVRAESAHELDALVETFGDAAEWYDISGNEKFFGHDGVRTFYADLFTGFPDFSLDVQQKHVAEEAILLEVIARGTHTGTWKGIPQTGKPVEFAICAIFTFDDEDKLREEKVYYDRLTVLTQLGVINP